MRDARQRGNVTEQERFSSALMLDLLRERGHRLTSSRAAITGAIEALDQGFSANDVLDQVQQRDPGVGRATVFRTLDLLERYGALDVIHAADGAHRYTRAQLTSSHYHLLTCSACGKVVPFEGCTVEEMLDDLSRETHFQISGHMLEVFGLCEACADDGRTTMPGPMS